MTFIKPKRLSTGDTVAVISPSWGGPGMFPHVFELGLKNLKKYFGIKIKEFPFTRANPAVVYKNPKKRALDINRAFADKNVKAIITSIGGNDGIRVLPFLDKKIIKNNPKIFMGYSDSAIFTTFINQLGIVTFNGPSIMAGFSQMHNFPKSFRDHIVSMLFEKTPHYQYGPFPWFSDGYVEWSDKKNLGKLEAKKKNSDGWHWLQGRGVTRGKLFGGCIEVIDWLRGTRYWPSNSFLMNTILFFETSEEKPPVSLIKYFLRSYGVMGLYDRVSGIIFGRARDYSRIEKDELDKMIVSIVAGEFGNKTMPIITNFDFGHTDPQVIMPLGVKAEINCSNKTFRLLESPVA